MQRWLERVARLVGQDVGLDLSRCRTSTLADVLTALAKALGLAGPDQVLDAAQGPHRRWIVERLISALLVHETFFYRYRAQLEELSDRVFPAILAARPSVFRIWSAGCATGPEPYSLAMIAVDVVQRLGVPTVVQVLGTDLAAEAIDVAKKAIYPGSATMDMPVAWREQFFEKEEAGWFRVKDSVRRLVRFDVHNLAHRPPTGPFHVITCRNVLMYLQQDAQHKAVGALASVLAKDGVLAVGHGESLRGFENLLVPDRGSAVNLYRLAKGIAMASEAMASEATPSELMSLGEKPLAPPLSAPVSRAKPPKNTHTIVLKGVYDEQANPQGVASLKAALADAVAGGLSVIIEADGALSLDGATARLILRAMRTCPMPMVVHATRDSVKQWARRYGVPLG